MVLLLGPLSLWHGLGLIRLWLFHQLYSHWISRSSQLTFHRHSAILLLQALGDTQVLLPSLKYLALRGSRPSVMAQCSLVCAPFSHTNLKKREKSCQSRHSKKEYWTSSEWTMPGCTAYRVAPICWSLLASSQVKSIGHLAVAICKAPAVALLTLKVLEVNLASMVSHR